MIAQRDLSLLSNRLDRHSHENSHTFYLAYEGPLPSARGKTVKTDLPVRQTGITIRERLVRPLEERRVLCGYAEYGDLPEDARVRVYSLDDVAVEKTVALLDRARIEPRDLYDLWFLAAGGHVRLPELRDLVARKLEFRGWTLAQVGGQFAAKEARYRKLWQVRLARRRWPSSRSSRRSTARSGAPCGRAASPAHSRKGSPAAPMDSVGWGEPSGTAPAAKPGAKGTVRRLVVRGNVPVENWRELFRCFVRPATRMNLKKLQLGVQFEMVLPEDRTLSENDAALHAMKEAARQLALTFEVGE